MKNDNGFTLVEVLFTLFIGLFLLVVIHVTMVSGQKSSLSLENRMVAHQDTRAALEAMTTEIAMSSFNSNFIPNIWINPADCASPSPDQAYKGIQSATANAIVVEMDINNSGVVGDFGNEVIAFSYDIPNQRITRATNCGNPESFLSDIPGNPRSGRVINNALNIPVFRYFDGQGNEILAANLPGSIPQIRMIQITLAVETEIPDPNDHQNKRLIYTTRLVPKNHATCQ